MYISNLFIPILPGCDGPIALCSTVVMYFDIYIGECHPLIVYTMFVEFIEGVIMIMGVEREERETQRGSEGRERERGEGREGAT